MKYPTSGLMAGILAISAILLNLTSCEKYPGVDNENKSQFVCWTHFDTLTDFTTYQTFTVCDSLGVISSLGKAEMKKDARSEMIRNRIIERMEEIGYRYVDSTYDLFISMNEVEQTNVSVNYDPYMYLWNSYDPWGWGYYYGYPYYPQYYIGNAYSTQTFSIQMGDKTNEYVTEEGKKVMKVIWSGSIKGITGYDRSDSEIQEAIDECFYQTNVAPFNTQKK